MSDGYKITRSNYTIKTRHANVTDGTVFERDFMTTNNFGGWDSGSIPNSEGNFKMVQRGTTSAMRQHYFGEFVKSPNGSEEWTLSNSALKGKEDVTSESKILIKTAKNSLLPYAYYGNCEELIKSTLRKIINTFQNLTQAILKKQPLLVLCNMAI